MHSSRGCKFHRETRFVLVDAGLVCRRRLASVTLLHLEYHVGHLADPLEELCTVHGLYTMSYCLNRHKPAGEELIARPTERQQLQEWRGSVTNRADHESAY